MTAITANVLTSTGIDLSTLYDELAGIDSVTTHTSTNFTGLNSTAGLQFEVIGTNFTYNGPGGAPDSGSVTNLNIWDSTHTTELFSSSVWSFDLGVFYNAIQAYKGNPASTSGLNGIFDTVQYNASGNSGNDTFLSGSGADTFTGGGGTDTVSYQLATGGLTADLLTPSNNSGQALNDTYNGISNLIGSSFNDTLRGDNNANTLIGGDGNDFLRGRGSADVLMAETEVTPRIISVIRRRSRPT